MSSDVENEHPITIVARGSMAGEDADFAVAKTVADIGKRLKDARRSRGLTLQKVAEASGLSPSMVSLVERGQASPSIGTLVALSDALSLHVAELFGALQTEPGLVVLRESQPAVRSADGVTRRTILDDAEVGIELLDYVFQPGAQTGEAAAHHSGSEIGFLVSGTLDVEVGDESHTLQEGDAIHFASDVPHRFSNTTDVEARALWVNVHTDGSRRRWGDSHK